MTTTPKTYLENLRERAQSVLAGVQRLEDLGATQNDAGAYVDPAVRLDDVDSDIWSLVDWIEAGRPDD
jgi:hypothetical protein